MTKKIRTPKMKRGLAYGDKRDYPKIEIFSNGMYVGTTTWARTIKEAIANYKKRNPDLTGVKITASRA
jgi:hypothetical protein